MPRVLLPAEQPSGRAAAHRNGVSWSETPSYTSSSHQNDRLCLGARSAELTMSLQVRFRYPCLTGKEEKEKHLKNPVH